MQAIGLAERGWLPDAAVRIGIRRLLRRRLADSAPVRNEQVAEANRRLRARLAKGPIAVAPDRANAQHYEVPPAFFERVLGPRLKYSCGLFERPDDPLGLAEERMLALSAERAEVGDGMRVLDLGCGWGALSLYLAERFPACRILAVSNSKLQREFVLGRAAARGLSNVDVVTADVNAFAPEGRFDRVLSVEMFEHVRNHGLLLARIARWLAPGGSLFVHHFSHRTSAYAFEDEGDDDWMARHFFTGGIMPSHDWLGHFQRDLFVEQQWVVDGTHYQRTAEAWLARQDAQRDALERVLGGGGEGALAFRRWRLFFLACAELFGHRGGQEWWVTHARMRLSSVAR